MNRKELQEAFALFDKDGDGCITSSELLTVMNSLGQPATNHETKEMIQRVDTDGNGLIDFEEFLGMMETRVGAERRRHRSKEADIRALFTAFDKDSSGFIDKAELKATMRQVGMDLTEKDVDTMMKVAGVAIGDRIFYEDFVKMMTHCISLETKETESSSVFETESRLENDPDIEELRVSFSMFDKDGDGQITADEVMQTMKSIGIRLDAKEVKTMVKLVDIDGDGTISFEEFQELMMRYKRVEAERDKDGDSRDADLKQTFQIFDKDRDGFLNACDLRSTMTQLGLSLSESDIHAMMRSVGVGPNGKICYTDFCKLFAENLFGKPNSEPKPRSSRKRASDSFSSQQKQELLPVFSIFDKDGDGFITMDEVVQVLTSMNIHPSKEYIKEIFQQVDLDGNNKIDFSEFLLLVKNYEKPLSEEQEIREMFNAIDSDRNGFIDLDELKATFTKLGVPLSDKDVKDMMREAGVEGNRIFYEDFVQIMMGEIGRAQKQFTSEKEDVIVKESNKNNLLRSAPPNATTVVGNATTVVAVVEEPTDFTKAELKELHVAFAQCDKDGDGSITSSELHDVITSLRLDVKPGEISRIIQKTDHDYHGRIKFSQFCQVMKQYKLRGNSFPNSKTLEEEETRQAFKVFDKNRDGYIDEKELHETMKELGVILSMDDIKAMMKKAGCEITGRIYYEEFVKLMVKEVLCSTKAEKSTEISDDFLQELKMAFSMVDKDGDGKITGRELMTIMSKLGFKSDDASVKKMISKFDTDGNGTLEFDEFQDMMKAKSDGLTRWERTKNTQIPPDTWKAFKVFDRNSDGYISKAELYQTMKELGVKLSMDDLDEMMTEADMNQDGRIDYAEFSKLMTGAFESFAKQAAALHEQKSIYEAIIQKKLTDADLKAAFDSVDAGGTGSIDAAQLEDVIRSCGLRVSVAQSEAMVTKFGSGNGKVGLSEFMMMLSRFQSRQDGRSLSSSSSSKTRTEEDDMRTAFRVFDIDGNGFIDAQELRQTMHDLGEELSEHDVDAMIRSADKNGDGQIDYEEFIQMMYAK